MANKQKKQKSSNNWSGKKKPAGKQKRSSSELQKLLAAFSGNKKRQIQSSTPFFPLAAEGDARIHFNQNDLKISLSSIATGFKSGSGSCTLSETGRITFTMEFSLPPAQAHRLIKSTGSNSS